MLNVLEKSLPCLTGNLIADFVGKSFAKIAL
jgi:hypothetical protein